MYRPFRLAWLPFEHQELMAQRQDFEGEIVPASEARKWVCQNDPKNGQHNALKLIANLRQSIISRPNGLSATHGQFNDTFNDNFGSNGQSRNAANQHHAARPAHDWNQYIWLHQPHPTLPPTIQADRS